MGVVPQDLFLSGLPALVRVLVVGGSAYVILVVLLRLTGKRTLAKLNAFDLIVTVALGSTLASALLSQSVLVAQAATAFALLVLLQLAVAWLSVRVRWFRRAVRAAPTLLVRHGQVLDDALAGERITREEVDQAVRSSGYGGMDQIGAVVLETDGTLSVISRSKLGSGDALDGLRGGSRQ